MRHLTFISLLVSVISATCIQQAKAQADKLNGTWVPVRQEIGGTQLPTAAFEKQKLILADSLYTVIAESTDKGMVKYTGNKIDIYGKDGVNAGKHFTAIYQYTKNQLTVCYNLTGGNYPEAFDTKGKPTFFLSVYKKLDTQ